jgi:hypothetical protein
MAVLVGTASDDVPEILATGHIDITTVFVSMTARHPEGRDAGYIEWHCLDHRPEMHRLASMRASVRLVSTPECRAARAASEEPYDRVDHVMTYLMASDTDAALEEFRVLNFAMLEVGRTPYLLPMIQRAVYGFDGSVAAPRIKVGADVLPWWPPRGVYLLLERGAAPVSDLIQVPGVAGVWSATGVPKGEPFSIGADNTGLQITYCYLDDDPVDTAERLRPVVEKRWADAGVVPLLAAPFLTIVPYEWGRYVP